VRRVHLPDLVDRLSADGTAPSTLNTMIGALGAIYGRAVEREELAVSPSRGVKLPAARQGRMRVCSPREVAALLAAVPGRDRAIWATAFYAGPRSGELMALRPEDVDLKAGKIHIARGWDENGPTTTKNRKTRTVTLIARCARSSRPTFCVSRPVRTSCSVSRPVAPSGPTAFRSAPTRRGKRRA
jgi:integrase